MESIISTVFDVLNLVLILSLWIYTLRVFKKLPEKIPTHFDLEGKPDSFGRKRSIYFLPILSLIFYIAFYFITRDPKSGNFPVEITTANNEIQFFIMILLMKWLMFLVMLLFLNLQGHTIRYSFNADSKAKVPILLFIPFIFISVMVAVITAYIYE